MKHTIDKEIFYPWGDIEGRYEYWEKKKNCKLTKELLEEAVKEGLVRSREVSVEGTPYSFTVYNESDIIVALAWHKFDRFKKVKTDFNKLFE